MENICSLLQDVMSVDEESTSCYCLMDLTSCHLLLDQPGSYALIGEPLTQAAIKRLKLAVFGSMEAGSMNYSLRVYCVDDTPHAFQVRRNTGLVLGFYFVHFVYPATVKSWLLATVYYFIIFTKEDVVSNSGLMSKFIYFGFLEPSPLLWINSHG